MSTYNGHKNRNQRNVSLWIGNDEGLYNLARECIRRAPTKALAAKAMLDTLHETGVTSTPDGVPYSVTAILAAMRDL